MALRTRHRRVDRELRQAHGLVDRITSFVSFSAIVAYVLDLKKTFEPVSLSGSTWDIAKSIGRALAGLAETQAWALALAATTLVWMLRYKRASRNEIEILVSCFSDRKPLPDWRTLHGSRIARVLAVLLTVVFLVLAGLVRNIEVFALVVFVWAIGDLLGNSSIQKNLMMLFRDKRFEPPEDDFKRPLIFRRRAVAESYWIGRPQLVRITIFLAIMGVVIIIAGSTLAVAVPFRQVVAYTITIAAILGNTGLMSVWRYYRDLDLSSIDEDEARMIAERAER